MVQWIVVVALVCGLAGCAQRRGPQTRVSVVEEARVQNCNPLGEVEESLESPADDPQLKDQVVDNLKDRARGLGATHIVYTKREIEARYANIKALAYSCED